MHTINISDRKYKELRKRYEGYKEWCVNHNITIRKFEDWVV